MNLTGVILKTGGEAHVGAGTRIRSLSRKPRINVAKTVRARGSAASVLCRIGSSLHMLSPLIYCETSDSARERSSNRPINWCLRVDSNHLRFRPDSCNAIGRNQATTPPKVPQRPMHDSQAASTAQQPSNQISHLCAALLCSHRYS